MKMITSQYSSACCFLFLLFFSRPGEKHPSRLSTPRQKTLEPNYRYDLNESPTLLDIVEQSG
jgi:hypothetical protein